jgi:hypothetical protein
MHVVRFVIRRGPELVLLSYMWIAVFGCRKRLPADQAAIPP